MRHPHSHRRGLSVAVVALVISCRIGAAEAPIATRAAPPRAKIVPHAFSEVSRRVATATVAGFIAGYLLS